MFTFFKLFVRGAFAWALSAWVLGALAQVAPTQSTASAPLLLPLNAKQQASLGVQVATVQASTGGQLLASATVVMPPGKEFTVSAPYAGQVSRLLVGVGDSVKAGAALAHFTSPLLGDARRLLNEASLDYKNASAAAQRDQAMFDEGIIPAVRLQLSRSKQEAAQAQLHAREAELVAAGMRFDANTGYATGTLKAPLSGTVSEAFVAVGQRVEAGAMLFKLADSSQLQLDVQLSSDKAAQLQVGDEVSIASRNAKAKIIGVSRAVDASQSARARATVTSRGSLQAGELVSVTVHAKGKAGLAKSDTQWLVPARAVTQWRGKPWLFVANDKGFEAQTVNVISSTDDLSLVEATLPVGSKVAVTGIASLRALLQKDE
ncbi:efflux RND transporter periplasmic adaptor subunit [Limnohabitans sp. INBF002]|uniref:efflux RND transporter periplasmic adaptor subunit n=1 Tax=Limnohabitans sp. INBF002 TaxID=2986280 RepID=UPI002376D9EE|nr:efflux RND transporter periplasmic adaptor subunit [Limnohabitans sp. INBF002]BDU53219.1 transporter [Limnohabitans sp. INBF002]